LGSGRFEIFYLAHHVVPGFQPQGYRVVQLGSSKLSDRLGFWIEGLALYRALREIQPDVMYHRVASGYMGVAAMYARRHGARTVWHIAHDSDVALEKSMLGRNPVKRLVEWRSIQHGIRSAHRIVAQTRRQAADLAKNYGRNADLVLGNFHPAPAEAIDKSGPLQVVWIATVKPWKRPEVFVRLAARLRALGNVRFVMVGPIFGGSGEWVSRIMQSIEQTPNIEYLGHRPQAEINALLAKTHIYVNTSTQEGFPNTIIQAWLREAMVISLTVDPDDVLKEHEVGIHAGTEERLEAATRTMLENAPLREEYTRRARQYALSHHSLANAAELVQLLDTDRIGSSGIAPSQADPGGLRMVPTSHST
jgi:glycosyltransferase involved in cell wall biosynthesis